MLITAKDSSIRRMSWGNVYLETCSKMITTEVRSEQIRETDMTMNLMIQEAVY